MVIWSDKAKSNLKNIYMHILNDSEVNVKEVIREILDKCDNLNEFPEMGRIVPELTKNNLRELIVYSYRVIYSYNRSRIQIIAVVYSR